ncbi:MAG: CBS domain-containing protein [Woeseiaceae bacterium]|nr:CBS domain-containing protein [Woeseiaceae bacterium]
MPYRIAIREFMTTDIVTLKPDMDVLQAVHVLLRHKISGAPVVDAKGNLVGMLTERDCMKVALDAAFHQQSGGTVADFMATEVETVSAEEPIITTVRRFYDESYLRFPVVDGTGLVGVISRRDVMQAIGRFWKVSWSSSEI